MSLMSIADASVVDASVVDMIALKKPKQESAVDAPQGCQARLLEARS